MTTYTWTITTIDVTPELNGLSNVVINVNWVFTGANENNVSGSLPGISEFLSPDSQNYIPYDQLTYEDVCTWLETVNNMTDLKQKIDITISDVTNPTYGTDQFPWS